MTKEYILVIRHSALGDIIIATAGFAAIRDAHPDAHIVCLTTKPYAELLAASPFFNEIWVDSKPQWSDRKAMTRLRNILNSYPWSFIYDLQTSRRTTLYQWLIKRPWPSISNRSRLTSHGFVGTKRNTQHALRILQLQLHVAGIEAANPDISWLRADITGLKPDSPYVILVPGAAPHRPDKRWPASQFAALAQELVRRNLTPVLIGTKSEELVLKEIATRVPQAINLIGKTSIAQVATLARDAKFAVGNDTGPMHVIAGTGCCPVTVLFSFASDPARCAPVGKVKILRRKNLEDLSVDEVLSSLTESR